MSHVPRLCEVVQEQSVGNVTMHRHLPVGSLSSELNLFIAVHRAAGS